MESFFFYREQLDKFDLENSTKDIKEVLETLEQEKYAIQERIEELENILTDIEMREWEEEQKAKEEE